jgi:phospholipid/cholesterol/gamma-HCH transport system permease protein
VFTFFAARLKKVTLEVQEYVLLTCSTFYAAFSRPFYRHDVIEQLDVIGFGSLAVVMLSGLFTGAALTLQSGTTINTARGRWSAGWSARRWSRSSARC